MNGRSYSEDTPEARLAAVARSLVEQMAKKFRREPDYSDYRKVFRPFLAKELILVRIAEARKLGVKQLSERMKELDKELREAQKALPDPFNLFP